MEFDDMHNNMVDDGEKTSEKNERTELSTGRVVNIIIEDAN